VAQALVSGLLTGLMVFTSGEIAAHATDAVTVDTGTALDQVTVPVGLAWNVTAKTRAHVAIRQASERLSRELKRLERRGATKITVVSQQTTLVGRTWRDAGRYIDSLHPWHLVATDDQGKKVAESPAFPADAADLSNYLVHLHDGTCSVGGVIWWNPWTWQNSPKCTIDAPSVEKFLRASLATAVKRATFDPGSWIASELELALAPDSHPTLLDGYLVCPELAPIFAGEDRIPLESRQLLGGYKITVDTAVSSGKITFLPPDWNRIAKSVTFDPAEGFLRFF